MDKVKYPLVIKMLKDRLHHEKKDLVLYELAAEEENDVFIARWGKGNINSCKKRIEELETVIDELNGQN